MESPNNQITRDIGLVLANDCQKAASLRSQLVNNAAEQLLVVTTGVAALTVIAARIIATADDNLSIRDAIRRVHDLVEEMPDELIRSFDVLSYPGKGQRNGDA